MVWETLQNMNVKNGFQTCELFGSKGVAGTAALYAFCNLLVSEIIKGMIWRNSVSIRRSENKMVT